MSLGNCYPLPEEFILRQTHKKILFWWVKLKSEKKLEYNKDYWFWLNDIVFYKKGIKGKGYIRNTIFEFKY